MKFKKSPYVIVFLLLPFCAISLSAQTGESDLKEKRLSIAMERQPLGKVLGFLIEKYDIPIGFEESDLDRDHQDYDFETNLYGGVATSGTVLNGSATYSVTVEPEFEAESNWITVNYESGKLADVLNDIVKQMNNYKWEINNNVVNIFPARGRNEKLEGLLNTKIKEFKLLTPKLTVGIVKNEVIALPEVVDYLEKNRIESSKSRSGLVHHLFRKLPAEIHLSDLSLRDLLNRITSTKRGGWILKWADSADSKRANIVDIDI